MESYLVRYDCAVADRPGVDALGRFAFWLAGQLGRFDLLSDLSKIAVRLVTGCEWHPAAAIIRTVRVAQR